MFGKGGKRYLVDSQSRKVRVVLSLPQEIYRAFARSPDNRTIYISLDAAEADVGLD